MPKVKAEKKSRVHNEIAKQGIFLGYTCVTSGSFIYYRIAVKHNY